VRGLVGHLERFFTELRSPQPARLTDSKIDGQQC
jgi:hypothetical protein